MTTVHLEIPSENGNIQQHSNDPTILKTTGVPTFSKVLKEQQRYWFTLGFFLMICVIGYFTTKEGKERN
jgi:hypothetical protein